MDPIHGVTFLKAYNTSKQHVTNMPMTVTVLFPNTLTCSDQLLLAWKQYTVKCSRDFFYRLFSIVTFPLLHFLFCFIIVTYCNSCAACSFGIGWVLLCKAR